MKRFIFITFFFAFFLTQFYGQEHTITIDAQLDDKKDILKIQQTIVFVNESDSTLTEIYLQNWPDGYRNRNTALSQRLIEDYNKSLYFIKDRDRGFIAIKNLSVDFAAVTFSELEKNKSDVLKISLEQPLKPKESVTINAVYDLKIPNEKFTRYGKSKTGYHLRYWYLVPAIFNGEWQLMSNLNMDDLMTNISNYEIKLKLPKYYYLSSNLYEYKTQKEDHVDYYLIGKNKTEALLDINLRNNYISFKTKDINVKTNLHRNSISPELSKDILNRQLLFIKQYLGKYPHKEIFIDEATQRKNPIYGLNQLPSFIRPFPDVFEWDLTMLKAMSKKYIDNTLFLDKRKDYWLTDGLQTFLLMQYVTTYYPEIKLAGNLANV